MRTAIRMSRKELKAIDDATYALEDYMKLYESIAKATADNEINAKIEIMPESLLSGIEQAINVLNQFSEYQHMVFSYADEE